MTAPNRCLHIDADLFDELIRELAHAAPESAKRARFSWRPPQNDGSPVRHGCPQWRTTTTWTRAA
jgi:hypothetical protein